MRYVLLREIAPADEGDTFAIATYDSATKTYKVVFFEDSENAARVRHHRLLFGDDVG